MKKIFFLSIALLGLSITGCKNDAIEIIEEQTPEPAKQITYNVASTAPYDGFDITESIKTQFLSEDSYYIAIRTYVYNKSGDRVDSIFSYIKSFQQVEQKFTLPRGQYTFVTIETLVNVDYDYASDFWCFENTEKLTKATVKLRKDEDGEFLSNVWWYGIIGKASKIVDVAESQSVAVSPSSIGTIVNVEFFNFDQNNDYKLVILSTKNQPSGLLLNPSLTGDNRYTWEKYNAGNYVAVRGVSGSSNGLPQVGGFDVYILESGSVSMDIGPYNPTSDGWYGYPKGRASLSLKDGDVYYVGLNYKGGTEGADCDAYIGSSLSGYLNWYANIITPTPTSSLTFKEPSTNWGATVSSVKSYMSGYTLKNDIQQGTNVYWMQYNGKDDEMLYEYDFSSSTTGLKESIVVFDSDDVTIDDLKAYFKQSDKYGEPSYDSEYNVYVTISKDEKTGVVISENSGIWLVEYINISSLSAKMKAPRKMDFQSLKSSGPKAKKNYVVKVKGQGRKFSAPSYSAKDISIKKQ